MPKGAKYGGRSAGTPNKVGSQVKDDIVKIIKGQLNSQKLKDTLDTLDGKDYIDAIAKLLPYVARKEPQEVVATDAMIIVRKRK